MKFVLETRKIDKISMYQRILCYYYYYLEIEERPSSEVLEDYEKKLSSIENCIQYYKDFFNNESIDNTEECVQTYDFIIYSKKVKPVEEVGVVKKAWKKVRNIIDKEINSEKKLHNMLNELADNHPIISKIIIAILTGILLGLTEDCIHDAIQNSETQNIVETTNIYIGTGDSYKEYSHIVYDGEKIVVYKHE